MNKQLIALVVGTALMVPLVASADVKIYGRISQELSNENIDTVDDGTGNEVGLGVADDAGTSRWGIKVSEKLGNGLTAFGVLEFKVYPGDRSDETNRQQHVGLKGSWGAVSLGTVASPWKRYGGTSLDLWNATHLNARRFGGAMGTSLTTNDFVGNVINYDSPKMNGFQFSVMVMLDERAQSWQGGNNTDGETDWFLGAKYKTKVFEVGASYIKEDAGDTRGTGKAWKVYGTYKFGNGHQVLGRYASFDCAGSNGNVHTGSAHICSGTSADGFGGGSNFSGVYSDAGTDTDIWFLAYRYKFGNNTFAIQLGETDQDNYSGVKGASADYLAIGITHKFSKRTRIFGGYAETDVNFDSSGETDSGQKDADRDAWTIGIRHDF